MTFSLVPCDQSGNPVGAVLDLPEALVANCQATADLYRRIGFVSPWIGYIAVVDNRGVGVGRICRPTQEWFRRNCLLHS
jgi:hypothetical protein